MVAILTAYVISTSTLKADDLGKALGRLMGVSRSTVSRIHTDIGGGVALVRQRPLGHTAIPHVFLDATYLKDRVGLLGHTRAVEIASGMTVDGRRDVASVST